MSRCLGGEVGDVVFSLFPLNHWQEGEGTSPHSRTQGIEETGPQTRTNSTIIIAGEELLQIFLLGHRLIH